MERSTGIRGKGPKGFRALIVEDESLARARLRRLLQREPDLLVVAECTDARTALDAFAAHHPDLVFLDISLPGGSGFDFLKALPRRPRPGVIIISAAAEHARAAFDHHVVDYLLKPFTPERLHEAIEKARARGGGSSADAGEPDRPKDFLLVKTEGRWVLLRFKDIDSVIAHEHLCQVCAGQERHVVRDTIANMQAKLPADRFFRVNRGTIINGERVRAIHSKSHGDGIVELIDGSSFTVSRRYRHALGVLYSGVKGSH